jgi:hypothetical protein
MPNFLSVPVAATVTGLLKEMSGTLTEYKSLLYESGFVFFKILRLDSLKFRFEQLKLYRHNFKFSETEKKQYADLVKQFEYVHNVNITNDGVYCDTNQTLLGEYA